MTNMKRTEIQTEEQRAIDLEESGDEAAALEIWLRLARANPTAGFYCRAGGALESLRRYSEAEAAFRSARELDPTMHEAFVGLGLSLINQGKFVEALEVLDAVAADGDRAVVYCLRGHALKRLGRHEEALQAFRESAAADPAFDEPLLNMGLLLKGVDDAAAKAAFEKAVELDDNYSDAHRELGWILRKEKQLESAERHLRRAAELNPSDAWAWVYLGNLLWAKGEFSAAGDAMKQAYEQSPNEWYPNWELASFYEDGGEQEKAARLYHRALLASPDESVLLFSYGRFLLKQGDREAAVKYLRRACEVDPGYEKARQLLREVAGE